MKIAHLTRAGRACLLLGALLAPACMYAPTNGQLINPNKPLEFAGFAQHPSATIHIEAFNRATNQWQTVKTATSSASPFTYAGSTLYGWDTSIVFSELSSYECLLHSWCFVPSGSASLLVRAREVGGGISHLVTFEKGGMNCVMQKIAQGNDMITAGYLCKSPKSPVLTLNILT